MNANRNEAPGLPQRLRSRFLAACGILGWLPLIFLWRQGWHATVAYAATFLLVAGDFLLISASFGALFVPGQVGRGAARKAVSGLLLRLVLLILGFYVILHLLSGGALAITIGIVAPLALLAGAGLSLLRG